MFEQRLRFLLLALAFCSAAIVVRLFQLQVVQADNYRELAERAVLLAPRLLPFVRGAILDRTGEVLVSDQASWNVTMDFRTMAAALTDDPTIHRREVKRWRRSPYFYHRDEPIDVAVAAFRKDMSNMWVDLAAIGSMSTPTTHDELRSAANAIVDRIRRIREIVANRRGFDAPVAEETQWHSLLADLDANQQIVAREALSPYPWVSVEPSAVRHFAQRAEPFAHLLGRMGQVDADMLEEQLQSDDPLERYQAEDGAGVSGMEFLTESTLRGRRGRVTRDREGNIEEEIPAVNGQDVSLTIHAGLQRRLYEILREAVEQYSRSSGGAIVVLDVPTREVLALVSYPAYDPNFFDETYASLRDDTERLPLRFRAVSARYPPGSTVKPLVCLAGFVNEVITSGTQMHCTGYLFEDNPDAWRCWQIHGTDIRKAHGDIDVVGALTGSCNVFMYKLADRLGVDRLCSVFDMAGIGRPAGTGLREESRGINPTPAWLMAHNNATVTVGTARLFAIGQGEMAVTPLQVANLMATYAGGRWRPVTLLRHQESTPEWTLPGKSEDWRAIRRGIYGVTNDRDEGTAYKYAHYMRDGYVLCGKTGSATAMPWPTSYRIPYVDSHGNRRVAIIREGARGPAIQRFELEYPQTAIDSEGVKVAGHWPIDPPTDGDHHSHAWFGGYLQAVDAEGKPDFAREPRIAFSVLVEFGGSGGQTSGPLAKRVSDAVLDLAGPKLDFDGPGNEVAGK